MTQQTISFDLPWPPTVNTYWRSIGRGRVIVSESGRAYRKSVIESMNFVMQTINSNIAVTIEAYPPDKRRRDLDNLPKAILDALTHANVWTDDCLIDDLRIVRKTISKPGYITITITILEQDEELDAE